MIGSGVGGGPDPWGITGVSDAPHPHGGFC